MFKLDEAGGVVLTAWRQGYPGQGPEICLFQNVDIGSEPA